ncbi:phosphoribosylanthranilate isomerase [Pedobacter gandavensis]|uniref:phosphoribosylanthranilate isomerase n=1 Tax=Pedobacter gandavensis TaxID=2679963 RepID=UPI00292CE39B|nr:phosphoribosylanthranilate isomerase [Pedobacter gandavensis]
MSYPLLKICGMLHPENISEVAALQPHYLGFIFFKGSKRYAGAVSPEVLANLPENIKKTGVFVNETQDMVLELLNKYHLNALQLHGAESPEYCEELKLSLNRENAGNVQLIKAFGLSDDFDFDQLNAYVGLVDYFLFDTQSPDHGGSGRQFNWQILDKYTLNVPYFLSGGIGVESAELLNGMKDQRLFAIDVNSKFEIEPGLKDLSKLKAFISKLS